MTKKVELDINSNSDLIQISNNIYCSKFLFDMNIETKFLPNQYKDYPYLIIDNFLTEEECNLINKSVKDDDNFKKAQLKKFDSLASSQLNEKIRKTNIYKLNKKLLNLYTKRFIEKQSVIENFFNIALTTSTNLQVLEYLKDSFYSIHSDDSSMLFENEKLVGFLPVAKTRKLSTVLFTTSSEEFYLKNDSSFIGGELVFNYLFNENNEQIKIKPKAGQMVVFLSNPFFSHEVKKVIEGKRISLVQWHNAIIN